MHVGIIGAMEPEVAVLKQKITASETITIGQFEFTSGELHGQQVVIVQSGIGKVASTIATTLMIEHFNPDFIVNTGSAGGFDPALDVGDVVISSELRHHDVDVTAFGYEIGQVPNMPAAFTAHPQLIRIAEQAANKVGDVKVVTGLITTGDSFMCDPVRIAKTREQFPTMKAVEMEGAAIAQCCYQFNVPFVVIRSLSDIAGKESPVSFDAYLEKAALYSSNMVEQILQSLDDVAL